jgi:hypothetical protein
MSEALQTALTELSKWQSQGDDDTEIALDAVRAAILTFDELAVRKRKCFSVLKNALCYLLEDDDDVRDSFFELLQINEIEWEDL